MISNERPKHYFLIFLLDNNEINCIFDYLIGGQNEK